MSYDEQRKEAENTLKDVIMQITKHGQQSELRAKYESQEDGKGKQGGV